MEHICSKCGGNCNASEVMPHPVTGDDLCLDCFIPIDDAHKLEQVLRGIKAQMPTMAMFLKSYAKHNHLTSRKLSIKCLEGNCHAASHVLVQVLTKKKIDAKIKRGHWLGSDVRAEREHYPAQQHSWVEITTAGYKVWVDPTQFVFTGKPAEIALVEEGDSRYDPCSYKLKEMIFGRREMQPRKGELRKSGLSKEAQKILNARFGARDWSQWTLDEKFLIANTKPEELGNRAREIFQTLVQCGSAALIPIDTREEVLA